MGKDRRDAGPSHCISVKLTILGSCALGPAIHLLAEVLWPVITLYWMQGHGICEHGCRATRPQIWLSREL